MRFGLDFPCNIAYLSPATLLSLFSNKILHSLNPFCNSQIFPSPHSRSPHIDNVDSYLFHHNPLGRIGIIEECGYLEAFLTSKEASFITGARFDIDSGVTLGC